MRNSTGALLRPIARPDVNRERSLNQFWSNRTGEKQLNLMESTKGNDSRVDDHPRVGNQLQRSSINTGQTHNIGSPPSGRRG